MRNTCKLHKRITHKKKTPLKTISKGSKSRINTAKIRKMKGKQL